MGATWRRPNCWKPGLSISAPRGLLRVTSSAPRGSVPGSSSQYQVVVVVVCRPLPRACEISPTWAAAAGTSRLMSVLLPMPLAPSTSVVRPLSSGNSAARAPAGSVFSASSITSQPIAR